MQLTNPCQQSFIPWNPYSQQDENHDCGICHETFEEHPFTADNIAIKHKGENGQKHPAVHLKCMKIWLETSNLCAYCQSPLNVQQLSLFSDILEEMNLTQFNLTRLLACAKEAEQIASTPAGILQSLQKTIRKETKHLKEAYQHFVANKDPYHRFLSQLIDSLEEMLDTASESDYCNSQRSLSQLEEIDLIKLKADYENAIQTFQAACKTHREVSEIYLLNERAFYHLNPLTQEYLTISSHENPLLSSSLEEMQEIGNLFSQLISTFSECNKRMTNLKKKHIELKQKYQNGIDIKISVIISLVTISFYQNVILHFLRSDKEVFPTKFDSLASRIASLTLSFGCFFIWTTLLFIVLDLSNRSSWKRRLNERFIYKIELPTRQVYRAVEFLWKAEEYIG